MESKPPVPSGRVLLRGSHPWAGYVGRPVDYEVVTGTWSLRVRLDNGIEVFAFDRTQWKRVDDA